MISTRRPTAKTRTPVLDLDAASGRTPSSRPGKGCEPITLSTAIFSGSGINSVMRAESTLSTSRPAMWSENGRASANSRRYTCFGFGAFTCAPA